MMKQRIAVWCWLHWCEAKSFTKDLVFMLAKLCNFYRTAQNFKTYLLKFQRKFAKSLKDRTGARLMTGKNETVVYFNLEFF